MPKNFSEISHDSAASNDQIIVAQEPEEPVDECDVQQDWRVHGQEDNINESEDQFVYLYSIDYYV